MSKNQSTGFNQISMQIYPRGSLTPLVDLDGSLKRFHLKRFSTGYPGGLFLNAEIWIPRDFLSAWLITGGARLVLRNNAAVVWEGEISGIAERAEKERSGNMLQASGFWGTALGRRTWNKAWADDRIDDAAWPVQRGQTGSEKCDFDRDERLRLTPKGVAWANNDKAAFKYIATAGETIKRVTNSYDFDEGTGQWTLRLQDITNSATEWSVTATGSGTKDRTLTTPAKSIAIQLVSNAAQTPIENGSVYGEVSNVMVYTVTGSVTLDTIASSVVTKLSDTLNSDTQRLTANAQVLEPFYSDGDESIADLLIRAAGFGGTDGSSWAIYLAESDLAGTPNGYPVMVVEAYPVLTAYDYVVSLQEANLDMPIELMRGFDQIANWISVAYRDAQGHEQLLTPDDNALLTDAVSVATYGQRNLTVDAGRASATTALKFGKRYLKAKKDSQYRVQGPLKVRGYIRDSANNAMPVSQVRAGQRVKLENVVSDVQGTGLTFIISQTEYTDAGELLSITTGLPDRLSVWLARQDLKTRRKVPKD